MSLTCTNITCENPTPVYAVCACLDPNTNIYTATFDCSSFNDCQAYSLWDNSGLHQFQVNGSGQWVANTGGSLGAFVVLQFIDCIHFPAHTHEIAVCYPV